MENKFLGQNHQSPEQNQAQQVEQYFNNQEQNTQQQPTNLDEKQNQKIQIQALPTNNNQKVESNTTKSQTQTATKNQQSLNKPSDNIIEIKEQISANPNGEGLHNAIDFANSANLQAQSEINNQDQKNKTA